jgi:hypothetical protein
MERADWVRFRILLMSARQAREAAGIHAPHLDQDDQRRHLWQQLVLCSLQDLGYNGYSVGGLYETGDNDYRRYGRALDAAEYIESDAFLFACNACGLSADKIRELSAGRISRIRAVSRSIGLLPPVTPICHRSRGQ